MFEKKHFSDAYSHIHALNGKGIFSPNVCKITYKFFRLWPLFIRTIDPKCSIYLIIGIPRGNVAGKLLF